MKYLTSIALILTISFAGELLNVLLPLPIPGSIYGLVLMLLCLVTGIFKLDHVKSVSDFLIGFMPIMFVSPAVGLITGYADYKKILIPIFLISVVTTVITIGVTGKTADFLIKWEEKRTKEEKKDAS